jgi:nucleoside-diphosphate-sugar epimerase
MRVFVAGASGTIGIPLVRALVAAGHQVTALTRSPGKQDELRRLGATPALADALDLEALSRVVSLASPTHVIHQLTALPKEGPSSTSDLIATSRLRIDGTRNLLDASIRAHATRFIGGSFALLPGAETPPRNPGMNEAADATRSMESQILEATRSGKIEGIVLRYGLFYGPTNPSSIKMIEMVRKRRFPMIRGDRGQLPFIHLDDAVSATLAALDQGSSGSVYDIVDDRAISISEAVRVMAKYTGSPPPRTIPAWLLRALMPYRARMLSTRLPLSNAKARAELKWRPMFPTFSDGFSKTFSQAA